MTIGERIKELRRNKNLTQETLADYLCVSYQAVSKWECGSSSPDLGLIIPLARFFNITTDELLGVSDKKLDIRYEELENSYNNTFTSGDINLRISLSETAVKEYPGDMKWLNRNAWDIWCFAAGGNLQNNEFELELDKAIKLFEIVIKNTRDDEIKVGAIRGIVQCLCQKGNKKEAKIYAEMFPEPKIICAEKKKLLGMCLDGEEQIRLKQEYFKDCFDALICTLLWDGVADKSSISIAAEKIINAVIPDEKYFNYHYEMAHIQFRKAEVETQRHNLNEAIMQKNLIY